MRREKTQAPGKTASRRRAAGRRAQTAPKPRVEAGSTERIQERRAAWLDRSLGHTGGGGHEAGGAGWSQALQALECQVERPRLYPEDRTWGALVGTQLLIGRPRRGWGTGLPRRLIQESWLLGRGSLDVGRCPLALPHNSALTRWETLQRLTL